MTEEGESVFINQLLHCVLMMSKVFDDSKLFAFF